MSTLNTYRVGNSYPPTAIALAEELGWEITNRTRMEMLGGQGPCVNWGVRVQGGTQNLSNVLNLHAPIGKLEAFEKMEEAGVSVPRFIAGPYITRAKRHIGGNDIRQYTGENRFVVAEIEKASEYRVEVFMGGAFRAHVKHPSYPPAQQPFNWNRENTEWESFGYRTMVEGLGDRQIIELAKQAVRSLNYDFGAVDIIKGRNGRLYVLEVNACPGLDEAGLSKYAYRIRMWANNV